ncbi:MAG: hypothetical protein QGF90_14150 [Gammaproteobacteria bacterium]|nr:hypothetical protein [Gammaproteobacteria bacterium]
MDKKVVDFESKRQDYLEKQREAKVDVLRKAFRQARGGSDSATGKSTRKSRDKTKKK